MDVPNGQCSVLSDHGAADNPRQLYNLHEPPEFNHYTVDAVLYLLRSSYPAIVLLRVALYSGDRGIFRPPFPIDAAASEDETFQLPILLFDSDTER